MPAMSVPQPAPSAGQPSCPADPRPDEASLGAQALMDLLPHAPLAQPEPSCTPPLHVTASETGSADVDAVRTHSLPAPLPPPRADASSPVNVESGENQMDPVHPHAPPPPQATTPTTAIVDIGGMQAEAHAEVVAVHAATESPLQRGGGLAQGLGGWLCNLWRRLLASLP